MNNRDRGQSVQAKQNIVAVIVPGKSADIHRIKQMSERSFTLEFRFQCLPLVRHDLFPPVRPLHNLFLGKCTGTSSAGANSRFLLLRNRHTHCLCRFVAGLVKRLDFNLVRAG